MFLMTITLKLVGVRSELKTEISWNFENKEINILIFVHIFNQMDMIMTFLK